MAVRRKPLGARVRTALKSKAKKSGKAYSTFV